MKVLTFLFLLIVFSIPPSLSLASEEDWFQLSMDELLEVNVNVANSTSQDVFKTPSTVTVLDKLTIQAYNFSSVSDAIGMVAGFSVNQSIIDRDIPTSRGILQNFYANKILILINGSPTRQSVYGNGYVNRIPIEEVERIEVLRGPSAVLYGTNALTGVVNIVTKHRIDQVATASFHMGVPDIARAAGSLDFSVGEIDMTLSVSSITETGVPYKVENAAIDQSRTDSSFHMEERVRRRTVTYTVEHGNTQFFLNGYTHEFSYLGTSPSFETGGNKDVRDQGVLLSLGHRAALNPKLSVHSNGLFDAMKREFVVNSDGTREIRLGSYRGDISVQADYAFTQDFGITIGGNAEYRADGFHKVYDVKADSNIVSNLLNNEASVEWSVFGQVRHEFEPFLLTGGVRVIQNEQFGSDLASQAALVYELSDLSSLKLMFGQAFRVPTTFEMYFNHPTVVGNPKLVPENVTNIELAWLIGSESYFLQLQGYHSKYNDLITRTTSRAPGRAATYANIDELTSSGFELEGRTQGLKFVDFMLAYSVVLDAGADGQDQQLHAPQHSVNLGLHRTLDDWVFSAKCRAHSEVMGSYERIPWQATVDLNIGYRQNIGSLDIVHMLAFTNINNSDMLEPEYIRKHPNINAIPTLTFGRKITYSVKVDVFR